MAGYHYHKRLGMPRHTLAFMTCYSWFEGAYGPIFFSRHRRFPLIFVYFQPLRWNICFLLFVINLSRYKVEILVWGPPGDESDPWIRSLKSSVGRFEKRYPTIKVTWEPVAWGDLDTKVNAALAAKQGPDILFEADREGEYPRRKAIRPLDD